MKSWHEKWYFLHGSRLTRIYFSAPRFGTTSTDGGALICWSHDGHTSLWMDVWLVSTSQASFWLSQSLHTKRRTPFVQSGGWWKTTTTRRYEGPDPLKRQRLFILKSSPAYFAVRRPWLMVVVEEMACAWMVSTGMQMSMLNLLQGICLVCFRQ